MRKRTAAGNSLRLAPLLIAVAASLMFGCASPPDIELPTVGPASPTATAPQATLPPPPKTLIICVRDEPTSLYLYSPAYLSGEAGREVDTIFQAIYDGPLDIRGFGYQPVVLEKAPSFSDGDARVQPVTVSQGEIYYNPLTLEPNSLEAGMTYLPAGCRDLSCAETYSGGEVTLDQLVVDFELIEGLRWSDGEPLTAADSVFSYQIDAAAQTPSTKFLVNHTQSYEALDDRVVRWTGIPSFLDNEYRGNFWSPLPQHVLGGRTAAELLTDEAANRQPIGWGAYKIDTWTPGRGLRLIPNPDYFRAQEGLPAFDALEFRFIGQASDSAIERLMTGECDILDESLLDVGQIGTLTSLAETGKLAFDWIPGGIGERLEFNLAPATGYSLTADVATRRALAACIDRQGIVDQVFHGVGQVTSSYIPAGDPQSLDPALAIDYRPAEGRFALETAGWVLPQAGSDGVRQAQGVDGIADGTRLSLSLYASSDGLEAAVAEKIQEDLGACGVEVSVETLPPADLLAEWPDGPVFGRSFGLAVWAWPTVVSPVCEMFSSAQLPSDANPHGINASGFNDPDYDAACQAILLDVPDSAGFAQGVRTTQEILADRLPALPLFLRPRIIAHANGVCGVEPDPTSASLLWNLESLRPSDECPPGS